MNTILKLIYIIIFVFHLAACSRAPATKEMKTLVVEKDSAVQHLFYTGMIKPLKIDVIPTPVDGVVVETFFQYGQPVKAGQLLFILSSIKFVEDYKVALMQYIKTKSDMNNAKTQLTEATFLHSNQLISTDDFKSKTSSYYAARLALLQAKDSLENLLKQLNIKNVDLFSLNIDDIEHINQAMHSQTIANNLRIIAPVAGTILSANKTEDETHKINKGDIVKQGDVLATIGSIEGIKIPIRVNELTVNQLKVGQKVLITGIAFADTLKGEITSIDRQGDVGNNSLPTFLVEVCVAQLSSAQKENIHIGMSAKVDIMIEEGPQIHVPLEVVQEKNGDTYVQVYDEKLKQKHEVAIKTGKTLLNSVIVLAGLKPGDKIVFPD